MQRDKFERKLRKAGWHFVEHGGNHDIWTNGTVKIQVPRHPDVKESLARGLIKKYNL
ncbi:type II toxin-antitoxin system HicA family toxin [Lapidilactobacillus bayanensis]|uniref:type II toxin-antitoxin system HicA family toxin n=1 Tax=Lapidilactobacillus bayanensis TaxID=2485998 RepID=UPI000F77ACEE|nr:type II toxin-antitoxin system HicA family toxin [Lapidilactobacillus bayanensis]